MSTKYTVDYFIQKFKAIPENKWGTGTFVFKDGRKCALGHCGMTSQKRTGKEAKSLLDLFEINGFDVAKVNDDQCCDFRQKTAKTRILSCLNVIKKQESLK